MQLRPTSCGRAAVRVAHQPPVSAALNEPSACAESCVDSWEGWQQQHWPPSGPWFAYAPPVSTLTAPHHYMRDNASQARKSTHGGPCRLALAPDTCTVRARAVARFNNTGWALRMPALLLAMAHVRSRRRMTRPIMHCAGESRFVAETTLTGPLAACGTAGRVLAMVGLALTSAATCSQPRAARAEHAQAGCLW